jgi:hypothetical protein
MTEPDARAAHRARAERATLEHIVQRLATQFPELGHDAISRAVRGEYDGFRDSSQILTLAGIADREEVDLIGIHDHPYQRRFLDT